MMDDDLPFRLTPLDVRRYEFPTSLRGYDKVRVDDFREQLASELERLSRLNAELDQKARSYSEQLKEFRDRDKALNDALVSAQQLRGEIREQADREAQLVQREARAEAERLLDDARAGRRAMEEELAALERMRRAQLAQMRALAERQLADVVAAERMEAASGDVRADPRVDSRADPRADPRGEAPQTPPGAQPGVRPSYPTPAWLSKVEEK